MIPDAAVSSAPCSVPWPVQRTRHSLGAMNDRPSVEAWDRGLVHAVPTREDDRSVIDGHPAELEEILAIYAATRTEATSPAS